MKKNNMDIRIQDNSIEEIFKNRYDLAIFSCGYEARSTFLAKAIEQENLDKALILKHDNSQNEGKFHVNEKYYKENYSENIHEIGSDDIKLYKLLNKQDFKSDSPRILFDYSSMTKMWYNAPFNWFKFRDGLRSCVIDFVYTKGIYKQEFHPLIIRDILSLPGCEGAYYNKDKTVAVFGLGFDSTVALTVLDRLEPDVVGAFYASPGSSAGDSIKVKKQNIQFLKSHSDFVLKFPINSVATAVGELRELLTDYLEKENIVLVPLGPKPHVLANIILAHRFNKYITCLRISGDRDRKVNVEPMEKEDEEKSNQGFVVTKVEFKKSE